MLFITVSVSTIRKIVESFKGQKICLYPAVNMLCGAILPIEHTCRRMGKS